MYSKEKFRAFVAAYLVLEKRWASFTSPKILNTGYQDGNYSVVAGHLEGRENNGAKETIIRESHEEAGIILAPEDVKACSHHAQTFYRSRMTLILYLTADKWTVEMNKYGTWRSMECSHLVFPSATFQSMCCLKTKLALENIGIGKFY